MKNRIDSKRQACRTAERMQIPLNESNTISSYIKFIFSALLISISMFSYAQYNLVWQDEFDGTALNKANWNLESAIGVWNTGDNQELEHYREENVSVGSDDEGNNCLIIAAKKETFNGYQFTSGRINTKSKFSFKYGKLEARIKMPELANGLWPAFWTLGSTNSWPSCGEIDILEMGHKEGITAGKQNQYIGGALHWENNNSHAMYFKNFVYDKKINEGYHVFTVEWTPQYIKMYVDSVINTYFVMNIPSSDGEEFTNYLHYIIFNLAVGGQLTGITSASGITAPFPAKMFVDWIRLYQKAGEGSNSLSTKLKSSHNDNADKQINIYPNPADNFLYLSGVKIESAYTIYDINGRKVKTFNNNKTKSLLDVSGLEPGFYCIETENNKALFLKR
jgi:beta-glucanase (GH16 family)